LYLVERLFPSSYAPRQSPCAVVLSTTR